jgi:hypothetical protein
MSFVVVDLPILGHLMFLFCLSGLFIKRQPCLFEKITMNPNIVFVSFLFSQMILVSLKKITTMYH